MKTASVFFLLLIMTLPTRAQRPVVRAQEEMDLFHYPEALVLLKKEINRMDDGIDPRLYVLMARCYVAMNQPDSALSWFDKAFTADSSAFRLNDAAILCEYATALQMCGFYSKAQLWFLQCAGNHQSDPLSTMKAVWCDSAMRWMKNPPRFEVVPVSSLNSGQSEFGIAPYGKALLLTSDRIPIERKVKRYDWTGNAYLTLYQAFSAETKSSLLTWKTPLPAQLWKTHDWHEGPISIDRTRNEAFINRSLPAHGQQTRNTSSIQTGLLKIFFSMKKGDSWSEPVPFFLNGDDYSVGHPALSLTGDTLFFVSDMPGGKGETDIYFCIRSGKSWSTPLPVSGNINTPGREMFPHVGCDGRFYFSSDGLPGFGGLDIFYSPMGSTIAENPVNCGYPINSPRDDFAITTIDSISGYFSSDRPGGMGNDDIYYFTRTTRLDSIAVLAGMDQNILPDTPGVMTPHIPDSLATGSTFRLENILYDFDRWEIRTDAIPSLDNLVKIMRENPVTIELSAHTDCRGPEGYNLVLSQKRAASAVAYLADRGIDRKRMTAKGYGETRLLNGCDCLRVVSCTESEHQENRRTEFRVTGIFFQP